MSQAGLTEFAHSSDAAKKSLAINAPIIVIIRANLKHRFNIVNMKIEIAAALLSLALLPACSTTSQTTSSHQTLEQRLMAKYANADTTTAEPAPPAEGPEDIPAEGPNDPIRNPSLVPTPSLRLSAASSTP